MPLTEDKQTAYFEITFDNKLTWRKHINEVAATARRKTAILRKRSKNTWGTSGKILSKIYKQHTTTPGIWIKCMGSA